jgi:hypothetical protein
VAANGVTPVDLEIRPAHRRGPLVVMNEGYCWPTGGKPLGLVRGLINYLSHFSAGSDVVFAAFVRIQDIFVHYKVRIYTEHGERGE